ncbi:MAG TPA: amino acid ABC transporter permease [Bauldia sp.]|nr:amino acid ABC transporter permease [Bauldia sp.]
MTTAFELVYVRREEEPVLAPPRGESGAVAWLRRRLFSSIGNVILTIIGLALVVLILPPLVRWAIIDAVWTGSGREACTKPGTGACWAFIGAKFQQFVYGRYPIDERWRVNLTGLLLLIGLIPMAIPRVPFKRENAVYLLLVFPVAATILLTGGHFAIGRTFIPGIVVVATLVTGVVAFFGAGRGSPFFAGILAPVGAIFPVAIYFISQQLGASPYAVNLYGIVFSPESVSVVLSLGVALVGAVAGIVSTAGRPGESFVTALWVIVGVLGVIAFFLGFDFHLAPVETSLWGGLLVTLVVAIVGIVASMPIGVLLALGRRSRLFVIRICSVTFIEFVRGVPLITVLFMASVMLPFFLPPGTTFDKLLRALIGVALFSSAYMAEVVRGGLAAIPRGQYEASRALGLNYRMMMQLIVLPQALKIVIPGIVNSFISLFKDTSLVLIIGIFDLLGIVQLNFADSNWAGPAIPATGYVFAAAVFWLFCFSMSRYSIYTERRLNTGHKR